MQIEAPPVSAPPPLALPQALLRMLPLACLIAILVVAFQVASGSRHSELGSHPDEAAHFITGLMVRDYLASGFHVPPLRYADEYYRHYPKIGLGVWPPFFYLVQAVWTLVFPVGIQSALLLMAALAIALGAVLAWALLRDFGLPAAAAGSVLFVSLPLVQQYSNMVMAEMLSALLMFCAALCFGLFLNDGGTRAAAGFGVFAGLAVMTKGTGLALVLLPPLAIALTGRFALLKNPRLWMAALIVLAIAGPWTWHFRDQGRGGWEEPNPSLRFTEGALIFYGRQLAVAGGWLLTIPSIIGALTLLGPDGRKSAGTATAAALVLAIWAFQSITPVGLEARHLVPAMPALIFLAMAGLRRIESFTPRLGPLAHGAVVLLFFGLPLLGPGSGQIPGYGSIGREIAWSPFRIPKKEWHGFEPMADAALAAHCRHMLVASDSRGEGMFIADVAIRDPRRPGYIVDRASKLLASSTWNGGGYQAFYDTPAKVGAALAKAGVEAVVIDSSPAAIPPHQQMLERALSSSHPVQTGTVVRDGNAFPAAAAVFLTGTGVGG